MLQLVQAAADALSAAGVSFGHGTTNAFDEAAWLVLWCLGQPLDALDEVADQPVDASNATAVQALLAQRIATRKPAAYLTGEAWLQGLPFSVDERVIVPRSFIAELIADGGFDAWLGAQTQRALDLCTGNGSLAVLAALAWPELQIDATDISCDALAVARLNVRRHGLAGRIRLIESDGLDAVSGPYDLVLCNPPYVNAQSMQALPAEYRAEPAIALAGGEDGMELVRRLLRELPQHLNEHGVLVLEIGNERTNFEAAFPRLQPVWLETSAGSDQVLLLTREDLLAQ